MEPIVWREKEDQERKIDSWIETHRTEFVNDLRDLVSVPSVSEKAEGDFPFGAECKKVLDMALQKAESYGFSTENYDNYCGSCIMKGEGRGELGMFSHLDVVPLGDGWEYPPLGCTEQDGFLIGRGVGDNKGPAMAALYAMRYLKEQGIPLKHDVLLYFGCSEEKGMEDIEHFRKVRKAPDFSLVPDTNFPVCYGEKGILRATATAQVEGNLISFQGGSVVNVIPATACAVIQEKDPERSAFICEKLNLYDGVKAVLCENGVKLTAEGLSSHAAFPEGAVNAIYVLAEALAESGVLTGSSQAVVEGIAALTGSFHGETTGIPFEDEETGRLTCCGTVVHLEHGKVELSFDIRYPASFQGKQVEEGLAAAAAGYGFALSEVNDSAPSFISPERQEVKLLCSIADHVLGKHYEPYTMGGGTYARHLPNAIGFGPGIPDAVNPFPPGRGQGHQPDECISLKQLEQGMKAYILALQVLDDMIGKEEEESHYD